MENAVIKSFVEVKQVFVNINGKVRITLENKTLDEDGFEELISVEKLSFEKNADVSNQLPVVQKICNDAWTE